MLMVVRPGDRVEVITTVYANPLAKVGVPAPPGEVVTVVESVNAGVSVSRSRRRTDLSPRLTER
jgi:hypothetical protein